MSPVEAENVLWTGVHDARTLLLHRSQRHLETHGANRDYRNYHVLEIDHLGPGRLKVSPTSSKPPPRPAKAWRPILCAQKY